MNNLVYPKEKTLGTITLVLGLLVWLLLIIGTAGTALIGLAIGFIFYLFAHSTLIAHIKGNGVELSEEQFPDLYKQFNECIDKLEIKNKPEVYILNGNGGLNAFATKFLGHQYVVLFSDVVDAMQQHDDGVKFYIGHELGHLRMNHIRGQFLRWPVLWLPLLGAAYSRARESTCDRHGLACSSSPENAARALAALSAGSERWQTLDIPAYLKQVMHSSGFWMSFHELNAGYPWLTKRVARVVDTECQIPKRNPFAYIPSIFVPYAGRLGGGFGLLITVYIIGILASIAIPAYQDYIGRSTLSVAMIETEQARNDLSNYYQSNDSIPDSLSSAHIKDTYSNGTTISMDPDTMTLHVKTPHGELIFTPSQENDGRITWSCSGGEKTRKSKLPKACQ